MLHEKETFIRKLLIVVDGVMISTAFFFAYFLRQNFHLLYKFDIIPTAQVVQSPPVPIASYIALLFFIIPIWCAMLYWNGAYRSMRTKGILEIVWVIIKATFLTTITFGTIVFLFHLHFVSRIFFGMFILAGGTFLLVEKVAVFSIARYVRKQGYNFRKVLIVGTGKRASDFIEKINKHPEWGINVLGIVDDEPGRGVEKVSGVDIIGTLEDISDVLHRHTVDEVIFVVPRSRLDHIEDAIATCETEGIKATVAVDLFDFKIAKAHQTDIDGIPFLTFETTFAKEWQLFVKRVIDIIISSALMIILSPLYLVVATLIKLTSPGSVLFVQRRIGLNGRRFVLFKFRTMYKGANVRLSELQNRNEMKGPIFKIKNDPRITPIGKFLRKFSIDELPQLFNVFMGCMSLVGPRPPLSKEVSQYKPWQRRRLSMRPGLTCLWQIGGRNKVSFDEWMKLDLQYLDNWSLWLDFKILVKTIPAVLFGRGAY